MIPYEVKVRWRCTSISGGGVSIVMEWTQDLTLSWQAGGTGLEANVGDWDSTDENSEETIACTSANTYYEWFINPSLLDYTKKIYVRLRDTAENDTNIKNSMFAMYENTTQAYRPQVIITALNPNSYIPQVNILIS